MRDLGEVFQSVCAIDAALGRTAHNEASAAGALKLVKTCGDHGFGPLTIANLVFEDVGAAATQAASNWTCGRKRFVYP